MVVIVCLGASVAGPIAGTDAGPIARTDARGDTADRAARWIATQVGDSTITTAGVSDPGLAADVALALAASGRRPDVVGALGDRLLSGPDVYVAPAGAGQVVAGAAAKLVLLAGIPGVSGSGSGSGATAGAELRARLRGTMVDDPSAPDHGRLRDRAPTSTPTFGDRSNVFSQALGVLALARSGRAPSAAVEHLLAQQCPSGGFRLFLTGGRGCVADSATDVDATALAVVALSALDAERVETGTDQPAIAVAVDRGLDRLEALQSEDGSFSSSGPGATANSNSTGLAAHALRTGGRNGPADRATSWVAALQLGCRPVADDDGAVAFNPAAAAAAADGITPRARDQFRRSTSQAILAVAVVPLGAAAPVGTPPPGTGSGGECAVPTTSSTTPSSTTPSSTTPDTTAPDTTAPGTTPSTTATSSTTPDSTAPTGVTSTAPPGATAAAVLGISTAATPVRSTGAAATPPTAALASTGGDARPLVPVGVALVGLGLLAAVVVRQLPGGSGSGRRRDPWPGR